jgi:hypothetical protein
LLLWDPQFITVLTKSWHCMLPSKSLILHRITHNYKDYKLTGCYRQPVPPIRWYISTRLYGFTSQKTQILKLVTKTSNLKSLPPFPKQSLPLRFCHQYVSCISSMPAAILLSLLIYWCFKKTKNDVRTNAAGILVVWYKINKPHYIVQFWITVDLSTQITERTIWPILYEYNASFVTARWRTIQRNTARPAVLRYNTLLSASSFPISLIKFKKITYSVYHKLH